MHDLQSLEIEALEREVSRLKGKLAASESECRKLKRWYTNVQEENHGLAIRLGDARSDLLTLQDFMLRRLRELESLRDVSARGLLVRPYAGRLAGRPGCDDDPTPRTFPRTQNP